ncbi:hypothetical protein [Sphingobacterium sp. UGAL515B_05]|uniref:hypothetical protein n=1 Tax=Sphingobacterium sp. UGAL515B_05 TaxID=2986767 RepID=UPI0029529BAC|nr:hypothetical protein [Sphingobacterium sp. UGAL515B_05]WON93995.1 hypothetical protein OK025_22455 [Sphingobacterium sp. UGAL515B_05]
MKNQFIQLLSFLVILFTSCSKNESNTAVETDGNVSVKMGGVSFSDENTDPQLKLSTSKSLNSVLSNIQESIVPFNNELSVLATLAPEAAISSNALRASTGLKMATTPVSLGAGAKYAIAVYNAAGNYVKDTGILTYSTSGTNWNLSLPAGPYTFVAIAVANGLVFPSINFNQALANITFNVTGADTDLLWKKLPVTVIANQTLSVDLILSHLFTQVQATLESTSANVVGNITSMTSSTISPNYGTASVKLTDGLFTQGGSSVARNVVFSGTGVLWTSNAALILTEGTTTGKVNFGTVSLNSTQNGVRSGTIDLSNLSLQKGVKYTLKLRLVPKGAIDVPTSNYYWSSANLTGTSPITIASAQYIKGSVYGGNGSATYCEGALGTGWRTATQTEYQSLINMGTARGSYNGQTGWFLGTSVVPTTNKDNYMFLPDNAFVRSSSGSNNIPTGALGVYWASATVQGNSKPALVLTATGVSIVDIHQNNQVGIRCVKSK